MTSLEYKLVIINEMILTMKLYKEEFDVKIDKNIGFVINDTIVNEYEGLADFVTKVKVMKYQKNKLANKIKLNNIMVNENDNNVDKYVSQMELIQNQNDLQKYNNCVVFDEKMGNMSEEQIQKQIGDITSQYIVYNENANSFLSNYGHFGNISAKQILTKINLSELIESIFNKLVENGKCYLNERLYSKSADHFEKMMDDPELQSIRQTHITNPSSNNITVNIVKERFNFPNNHIIQQSTCAFRDNLFTLYVLLISIPETKVFLNQILNDFASVDMMDKKWSDYYQAQRQYIKDRRLNRAVLPRSIWESFMQLFISHKSNGELKVPFSDLYRYISFRFEVAGIENEYMVYENNILSGNGSTTKNYNYIKSIFGIDSKSNISTFFPDQN